MRFRSQEISQYTRMIRAFHSSPQRMFCCSKPSIPETKMFKTLIACCPTCERMKRHYCVDGLYLNIRRIRGSRSCDCQYPNYARSKCRFIHQRLDFDRISDALEQNPKLPEVATKAPPVGRAAPCQSDDWLGAQNCQIKIQALVYSKSPTRHFFGDA